MVSSSRRHESGEGSPPPGTDPDYEYPKDEFDVDDWAGPVGAHRAARKSWFVALPWLAGAAVILLLTGIALSLGFGRNKDENASASTSVSVTTSATSSGTQAASSAAASATTGSPSPTGSSAQSATATVDKKTRIQILNATRRNGLAHKLQATMKGTGWNVASVETYRKKTVPSVVYYRDPTDKATAEKVAELYDLGTKQSQGWPVPITLMIGNDFPQS